MTRCTRCCGFRRRSIAGRSLAAVGIAAHEAGHAIQDAARYPGLVVRNSIVPLASIGSTVCWLLVLSGLLIGIVAAGLGGDRAVFARCRSADRQLAGRIQRESPGERFLRSTGLIGPMRKSSSAEFWMRRLDVRRFGTYRSAGAAVSRLAVSAAAYRVLR